MTTKLAFDVSAWQGRPPLLWFQNMKAAGYDLCWIQLWGLTPDGNGPNPHSKYQLSMARAAGMDTGGYIVIYGDVTDDTSILVKAALDAAGTEKPRLKFVALDVETAPLRMERLVNAYRNIGTQLPGIRRAMYTSRWKWSIAFGTTEWPYAAETPLLEARYVYNSGSAPSTPPSLEWFWLPFGGWTERAMLQYAGTVDTLGVGVDRNVFDRERMMLGEPDDAPPAPPGPEEGLTMSQYQEIMNLIKTEASKARAFTQGVHDAIVERLAKAEARIATIEGRPAPAPAPTPSPPAPPSPASSEQYVTVKSGDYAGKWFSSEADLLRLNPNFKTLAYNSAGGIMRRFSSRSWGDIYPPERLRVK